MARPKRNTSSKRRTGEKYQKYSYKTRLRLIKMVESEGKTVSSSAKFLGIKQTSARLIMEKWTENGYIFEKREDKQKRILKQKQKAKEQKRKEGLFLRGRPKKQEEVELLEEAILQEAPTEQKEIKVQEGQESMIKDEEILPSRSEEEIVVAPNAVFYFAPVCLFFPHMSLN